MKPCIRCGAVKPLDAFYTHPMMGDGHLNKCKECCKVQARVRHYQKSAEPEWVEAERARGRAKARVHHYPPSKVLRAAHSAAVRAVPVAPSGMERHHWSYLREHWTDVILLSVGNHRALHCVMTYDEETKQFRTRNGHPLNTRSKHIRYMLAAFNVRAQYQVAA
jgi:hypothetical protein